MGTRHVSIAVVLAACANGGNGSADAPPATPDAPRHGVIVDAEPDAQLSGPDRCFPVTDSTRPHPDYNQFNPIINADCTGTNNQTITGVERVVFLGDSITTGTPPTLPTQFYRTLVELEMRARFGLFIAVEDCSKWGARNDDFLGPPNPQLVGCFPSGVETRKTLIVMTMGGNDMSSIAKEITDNGDTPEQTTAKVELALQNFEQAITWLKDPAHFPNGSYVVYSNIYEFTDATGDLASCPAAGLFGFGGTAAPRMTPAYLHVAEQYLRIAIDHQVDEVFALESFCGHGYHSDDPSSPCYRGPNTERWFDLTCIHPNPTGHQALAHLFTTTIED